MTDRSPMQTDPCGPLWQNLPDMAASLAAEYAGAAAALDLLKLWHLHAACRARHAGRPGPAKLRLQSAMVALRCANDTRALLAPGNAR